MTILRHLEVDRVKWPNFATIYLTSGISCLRIAVNYVPFSLENPVKLFQFIFCSQQFIA